MGLLFSIFQVVLARYRFPLRGIRISPALAQCSNPGPALEHQQQSSQFPVTIRKLRMLLYLDQTRSSAMRKQRDEAAVYILASGNNLKECASRAVSIDVCPSGRRRVPEWVSMLT